MKRVSVYSGAMQYCLHVRNGRNNGRL